MLADAVGVAMGAAVVGRRAEGIKRRRRWGVHRCSEERKEDKVAFRVGINAESLQEWRDEYRYRRLHSGQKDWRIEINVICIAGANWW